MRSGTPRVRATERALVMLDAVIADGGRSSISVLARSCDMATATAHRQVATLVAAGYLASLPNGRHLAGPRLLALSDCLDVRELLVQRAGPTLDKLAQQLQTIVHLGSLENEMITYRLKTGNQSDQLFTQVGMQLEAYCSGIGKALLAQMGDAEREAYLATGPFPSLTQNTITDPSTLRAVLQQVRKDGFAFDREEMMPGVYCVAAPICNGAGIAQVAISATFAEAADAEAALPTVLEAARIIQHLVFGP